MPSISDITIDTPDGPMPAHLATPDAPARGAVVVMQEAFGVTTHIADVADRFAAAGWLAVAPALFHREGSPVFSYDDVPAVRPSMNRLTSVGLDLDVTACLDHLADAGHARSSCCVVGFCMGGSVAFYAAATHRLGAAASFYGGGIASGRFGYPAQVDLGASLQTPWLGLYGDRDQGIPVDEVEALREVVAGAPVDTDLVRYPEAEHGFHCDDRPAVFDPPSAADAWRRTLEWFDAHVPPKG